jgi:hypothetical protein
MTAPMVARPRSSPSTPLRLWRKPLRGFGGVTAREAKAKLPLAAPIALNARVSSKLPNWCDPAILAKLADAYERARDHEGAARLLGVTVGGARLAKRRYLDRAAIANDPKGL